jgi:hemerythrin-like domain-containing protein
VYEATKVQRDEHEVILRVLHATEARPTLSNPVEAPAQFLSDVVEFLGLYADRQRHGKEEDLLFHELEKKGLPRSGGPVGVANRTSVAAHTSPRWWKLQRLCWR